MLYIVAALMLGTALVLLQISRKKSAGESARKANRSQRETARFASVKLDCDDLACPSAVAMRGKAFLAAEAPTLPLAACDAAVCQCKYAKTTDRRGADDGRRAMDIGIRPIIFDGAENRSNSSEDRRAS